MPVPSDLKRLSELFESMSSIIRPILLEEPEIDYWDIETENGEDVVEGNEFRIVNVKNKNTLEFKAFVDGAQRIIHSGNIILSGQSLFIPIYVGQIGAAVLERNERKLIPINDLCIRRTVIAFPVEGVYKTSTDRNIKEKMEELMNSDSKIVQDFEVAEDPLSALSMGEATGRIIICDITYPGLDREHRQYIRKKIGESINEYEISSKRMPLIGARLSALSIVRTRAHSRINVLRQLIEMLVLTEYRLRINKEDLVLVDGPLFLLGKWFKKHPALRSKSPIEREEMILYNSVGLVKRLRRSPPKRLPNYPIIHSLRIGQRTTITMLRKATSSLGEEAPYYDCPHLTYYLRFRQPPWLSIPHYAGLIRVDLFKNTLDIDRIPEKSELPQEASEKADLIANTIWREAYPLPADKSRFYTQPFPIEEAERYIRSGFYSTKELQYLSFRGMS